MVPLLVAAFIFARRWTEPTSWMNQGMWLEMLIGLTFLSLGHTCFTAWLVYRVPGFKEWWKIHLSRDGGKARRRLILVISGVCLYSFLFAIAPYWVPSLTGPATFFVHPWILALLLIHHYYGQMTGFQAIYDAHVGGVPAKEKKRERGLLAFIGWGSFFGILVGGPLTKLLARGKFLELQKGEELLTLFAYLLLGCVALLIFRTVTGVHGFRSGKALYQLRLFLFPLSILDARVGLAIIAAHGVEYTLLMNKSLSHSVKLGESRRLWPWGLLFMVLLFSVLSIPNPTVFGWYLNEQYPAMIPLLALVSAVVVVLNLLHYYVEASLYRMRDPEVRRLILPILLEKP